MNSRRMGRLSIATAVLGLLALQTGGAVAQMYKYRDPATGKMVITDTPPAGQSIRRQSASATSDEDAEVAPEGALKKSGDDPRLAARKAAADANEERQREQEQAELAGRKRQFCADLERNLRTLESGQRIARMNDSGEREFMSDEARAAELERVRSEMANCEQ